MSKTSRILGISCAAVAAVMMAAPSVQAQEVTLRFHTLIPPVANPIKTYWAPWAKKVEAESKGRIKVDIYPSMQLGGTPPQLVDQVKDGVVDLVWTIPGYTAGRFPRTEVFELPFIHSTPQATTAAIQDFAPKYLLNTEFKDYHVLLLHCHAGSMFMSKKPITKVSDLNGMKIRTATRVGGWYLKSLGAVPIGAPVNQVAQMMSKGVVDAALLPYEIAPAVKMQELADHYIELEGKQPRMNTSVFSLLMNPQSYAKLSADNKKVIDMLSGGNIAESAGQNWADIEVPAQKLMASRASNKFTKIPAAEVAKLKAAAKPAIDEWLKEMKGKGIDGDALLADARAMVDKYTK